MDITHAIAFVVGMLFGGAIVVGFFEWDIDLNKPTSRAVDPKSPLR